MSDLLSEDDRRAFLTKVNEWFAVWPILLEHPKQMKMYSSTTARIAGVLFLLPLIVYGSGSALIGELTEQPDVSSAVARHTTSFIVGIVLLFLNSLIVAAIAVVLFPVLGRFGTRSAIAYLATRLGESLILCAGLIFLLLLLPAGEEAAETGTAELLVRGHYYAYQLAMIALGTGSVFFCALLYRSQLIPRWAAAWGMGGYALLAAGSVLELLGVKAGVLLSLPGGLFELFLGLLLIVKGFGPCRKPV